MLKRLPPGLRSLHTEARLQPNRHRVGRPSSNDAEEPRWLIGLYEAGGLYDPPRPPGLARCSLEQVVTRLKALAISKRMQLTIKQLLALIS